MTMEVRFFFTATFDERGKAARGGAGWHSCLDLLARAVDDAKPPWSAADRWREVCGHYRAGFGPEASTIGPPEGWERVHGSEVDPPGNVNHRAWSIQTLGSQ